MSLIDEVYSNIKERKHNVEIGKINGIPLNLAVIKDFIPSIERGNYYLIAGCSKAGKTQLCNYAIIYNSILYAYENPDKVKVHIILFPLEEGKEMTLCRFMSYILYTRYKIRISPTDLMSSNAKTPLTDDILAIIESEDFLKILRFYESCIQFETANNSVAIDRTVKAYAKSHGEIIYGEEFTTDEGETLRKIVGYKPHDENEYVFVILDNINLIMPNKNEKGLLDAGGNVSKNMVSYFTTYKYICVVLQQCLDSEINDREAAKIQNLLVSKASLKDVKSTGNDATVFLGITNPGSQEIITTYKGYDLVKTKRKYLRWVNIVFQRFGEAETGAAFFFDGAVNYLKKAPLAEDTDGINKMYKYIDSICTKPDKNFVFSMLFKKLFKKNRRNG